MKNLLPAVSAFIGIMTLNTACAADGTMHHHNMNMMDTRVSLELSAEMKQHQLSNMREHLAAVESIIGLMSENKFDDASKIAHGKLGLTPEMQKMCSMFNNEKFTAMGIAFHKSGDDLGNALQSKDMNASLRALNKTMQHCTACHETYRQ